MIEEDVLRNIKSHAYIPEHIPEYVSAISEAEPFFSEGFVYYKKNDDLIFIGYPLWGSFEEERMRIVLDKITEMHNAEEVYLIAPRFEQKEKERVFEVSSDTYYRYDLALKKIPQKVRNMINRAQRDVEIDIHKRMGKEHIDLIEGFLDNKPLEENMRYIFEKIPEYISKSGHTLIIEARDREGIICGFNIGEFDSEDYAFYMFNITSEKRYIPGLSDLLLYVLLNIARNKHKRYVNLGLGINGGIRFFKEKWGATPFLDYRYVKLRYKRQSWGPFDWLLKGTFFGR